MATWLKQSTAVSIGLGPFLNDADGKTALTALSIAQADIRLKKNAGSWAQKSQANAAAHQENGWYEIALDTTDTGTLGILVVSVSKSGALPVWREFMVVPANVYDSMVTGSSNLQVNTTQIEGSDATDQINAACDVALADYDAPTNAEMVARTLASASYATASALATTDGKVDAVKAKTDNLPSDPADQSLIIAATDAIALAVATVDTNVDAILEDTGTTLPATLATIEGKIDTVDGIADAIKAKTDNLNFGVTGKVDANITHVHEIEVTGDGDGTPWGPA